MMDGALWVFGYGSLVWRPAFAHLRREHGRITGFKRRFWQGSTDHRGVPGAPGRVVTLLPETGAEVWGTAYEVSAAHRASVLAFLDHREQGGYDRHQVEVQLVTDRRVSALVYVATPENPNYLGEASAQEIAAQIRGASGPSGANAEYVVELHQALEAMGADDAHVLELYSLLRE